MKPRVEQLVRAADRAARIYRAAKEAGLIKRLSEWWNSRPRVQARKERRARRRARRSGRADGC